MAVGSGNGIKPLEKGDRQESGKGAESQPNRLQGLAGFHVPGDTGGGGKGVPIRNQACGVDKSEGWVRMQVR